MVFAVIEDMKTRRLRCNKMFILNHKSGHVAFIFSDEIILILYAVVSVIMTDT